MPRKYRWDEKAPPSRWQEQESPEVHWQRRLQQARETPAGGIRLGKNVITKLPIYIAPEDLRTHMHVIGATNVGKSYFLEAMIRQLVLGGHGLCLIDPHGDLYHRALDFCARLNMERPDLKLAQRVVPFDVAETQNIIGFNPVARNARVMTYQVVALMEAIRKCWSQATFDETPRLARWLFNAAYAVIDSRLTFIQTHHMVDPTPNPYRKAITARIRNPRIRAEWEWLSTIKPEKREERVESCLNRVKPFVEHEIIRCVLGQYTNTLDFPSVLAGRKILLVNLAKQNVISEDNQHLLGTLLVNDLLTAAFARPAEARIPFFCFIDEFQHFVTKDMCEILDGGRKFGLHLILAHQHLNQLKLKDPEVYYSALTNARTKVVFGGLIDEDLEILAKELYTGEFDPDEVKHEIWQTKYEPVETTRTIRSSTTAGSTTDSSGEITHESLVTAEAFIPGSGWFSPALVQTTEASGTGSSRSTGTATTSSWASSKAVVPWYEYHKYAELSSRTFRDLEEQLYIKKAQMKRQPGQHTQLLVPEKHVQLMKTPTLKDFPIRDRHRQEFKQACMAAARCFKSPEDSQREIQELEDKLLRQPPGSKGAAIGEEQPRDEDLYH